MLVLNDSTGFATIMQAQQTISILIVGIFLSLCTAGCGRQDSTAPGGTAKNTAPATPSKVSSTKLETPSASSKGPSKNEPVPVLPDNQAIDSAKKLNLDTTSDNAVILTVGKEPLTVGEYRRMFKIQMMQLQNAITSDPEVRKRMVEQAKKQGITLTPEEKSELAYEAKSMEGKQFDRLLKSRHESRSDFEQDIMYMGLANKAGNLFLRQHLLNDLVNRVLLISAAKNARLEDKAQTRYFQVKGSPAYHQLLSSTGLSASDLKNEITRNALTDLMIQKIAVQSTVSSESIRKFYEEHSKQLQHPERIRLSEILVAAPIQDLPGVPSIASRLKASNPKLSGDSLKNAIKMVTEKQNSRARDILAKAESRGDFAALANESSDDDQVRKSRNGGDAGWQTRASLPPELANIVSALKPGDVVSKVVETPLGFYVIKVTGKEGPGTIPLDEAANYIRRILLQQQQQKDLNKWLAERQKDTPITFSPGFSKLLSAKPKATER